MVLWTDTIFGLFGAVCFGIIVVYARRAYINTRQHQQISLAMIFLHDRSIRAFQLLAFSLLLYACGMAIMVAAVALPGGPWYEIGSAITFCAVFGLMLFTRNMEHVTRKPAAIPEQYPLELQIVERVLLSMHAVATRMRDHIHDLSA